jgi:hypothetical protein
MKTKSYSLGVILSLVLAPIALAAPSQRGPAAQGPGNQNNAGNCVMARDGSGKAACPATCLNVSADPTPLALSPAAQTALLFQIDEERMARELYTAFNAKWALQPFANIPQSEARHEATLRQIASRAAIAAPTSVAGSFDSAEVQQRYNDLLALGLESADSALRAAAFVEEQDIADLNTLIAATDNPALKDAAMALKTASGHHLQAFVSVLAARGVTYLPKVLTADEYQAILGSDHRGMGRRRGFGRG